MATQEKKPISEIGLHKAVYDLLYNIDSLMDCFCKDRRHTIYQTMYNQTLEMFDKLYIAYEFDERRESSLIEFLCLYHRVEVTVRLCTQKGYIPRTKYVQMIHVMGSIERQANGWLKSVLNAKSKNSPAAGQG